MRSVFLVVAGFLGMGLTTGCGADSEAGRLRQVSGEGGLVILPDGAILVPDTLDDTSPTDTAPDDTTPADTAVPPDSVDSNDTAGPDTDDTDDTVDANDTGPADTVDTVDVGPIGCSNDNECPDAPCRPGRCDDGTCTSTPATGTSCDDGDPCTPTDRCAAGACVGSGLITCADGDACTDDGCTPGVGCENLPKTCDDGNACTADECRPGTGCVSSPITCAAPGAPCLVATCDPQTGCGVADAEDGTNCSDGDACTTGDGCRGGECSGTARDCDDGNACTTDTCVPQGGCVSLPIPNCAVDQECVGRSPGASCDDGDNATSADMCILGVCRGFALTRIPGTAVQGQQGLVLLEIDYSSDHWSSVFWTADNLFQNRFALARVTTPSAPTVYGSTLQSEIFAGLRDGFVGDGDGRIWRFANDAWSRENGWDTAIGNSGRGAINDVWTDRDRSAQGVAGARRLWTVGEANGEEWIRYCVETNNGVTCAAQALDDFDDSSIPQAVAGVPNCAADGSCVSSVLGLGADAWAGGDFYNDTYLNPTGVAATWSKGRIPENAANRSTQAIAAWGSGSAARFLVVGTGGYMVQRRANGTWSDPLAVREGQSSRDFLGAWQGAEVVVVAAYRGASNNQVAYELWVAPSDADLALGSSWVLHELGRGPDVNAAGLYDVHGRPTGEIRAVGALRRTGGFTDWLDGAVWIRTP